MFMKNAIACGAMLAALIPLTASAQSGSSPADPAVAGPPLDYRSAFTAYRSYTEERLRAWRDVNDEVRRVGGHAGVVGSRPSTVEERGPQAREDAKPEPRTPPMPDNGHRH